MTVAHAAVFAYSYAMKPPLGAASPPGDGLLDALASKAEALARQAEGDAVNLAPESMPGCNCAPLLREVAGAADAVARILRDQAAPRGRDSAEGLTAS